MHERAHHRFGEREQARLVEEFADRRRDGDALLAEREHAPLALAQDAEAGLELRLERLAVHRNAIMADAEEHEVVGNQPFEELNGFGDLVDRQQRRIGLEPGDDRSDVVDHRPPVLHAETDVREHLIERFEDGAPLRLAEKPDMDVDEAFARCAGRAVGAFEARQRADAVARQREHRVRHEPNVDAAVGELGHHRVDQERHVVVEDFENLDAFEMAPGRRRHVEAKLRGAGRAHRHERPGRSRERGDLGGLITKHVLRRRAGEQAADEVPRDMRAALVQQGAGRGDQTLGGCVIRGSNVFNRHRVSRREMMKHRLRPCGRSC